MPDAVAAATLMPGPRIVLLDGARHLGAKILVAGGGRCNVTHDVVDERAFAGSSPHAIRKVLRRFDVRQTIEFFRALGVELKREETGKLFPTTDNARTVLNALLQAARDAGVEIMHPWRVECILSSSPAPADLRLEGGGEGVGEAHDRHAGRDHDDVARSTHPLTPSLPGRGNSEAHVHQGARFVIESTTGEIIRARRVILATGGRSLPKTGSDGHGYAIARSLGHSITPRIFAGLVPLTLPKNHFICGLSGLSVNATLEVRSATGRKLISFTDSTLCTHFGLSGPSVLDISRYYTDARLDDPAARLIVNWLPSETMDSLDRVLQELGRISSGRFLRERSLPQRLAEALCDEAGVDPSAPAHQLAREKRRALAAAVCAMVLPITGDRGFAHAEVTAGGIPLSEIRLETMESRLCPGLFIIGEICDVDGRIGGYNFQWAWASGHVAGTSIIASA